jgi:hypothetical protein
MNVLTNRPPPTDPRLGRAGNLPEENETRHPTRYRLTLILAGITAEDYLQWIRDPDPPAGPQVQLVSAQAAPGGNRIELELLAQREPPTHRAAATAVGFPTIPEVIGVHRTPLAS